MTEDICGYYTNHQWFLEVRKIPSGEYYAAYGELGDIDTYKLYEKVYATKQKCYDHAVKPGVNKHGMTWQNTLPEISWNQLPAHLRPPKRFVFSKFIRNI